MSLETRITEAFSEAYNATVGSLQYGVKDGDCEKTREEIVAADQIDLQIKPRKLNHPMINKNLLL